MTAGPSELLTLLMLGTALVTAAAAGADAPERPFLLPLSARVSEPGMAADGGWRENGEVRLTYVQTESSFMSEMARGGWKILHVTTLNGGMAAGTNRSRLYTWRRGGNELTLMLWRIDVGKTGFSWGVSSAKKQ